MDAEKKQTNEASSGGYHETGPSTFGKRDSGARKVSRAGFNCKVTLVSHGPGDWPVGEYRPCGVTKVGKREWELKDGREELVYKNM